MQPIPKNEKARLRELQSLSVFSAPHPELQSLTEIAAKILRAPISLVSLVGASEQKFAANVGLEGATGTPRDVAFCAHAIMKRDVFVVPDATTDERFQNSPLVTGFPNIRAYAGIPLETAPGCRVGTLCAIDTKSRRFSSKQLADLRKLGGVAVKLLQTHRANLELRRELFEKSRLQECLEASVRQDGLTGLANRRHLDEQLTAEVLRARRSARPISFVMIDIDHFKKFNDTYGHLKGDDCLRRVAAAVKHSVKRPADLTARFGGEEFSVLLPETDADGARSISESICAAVRAESVMHAASPFGTVTVSVGWATVAGGEIHIEHLVDTADRYLYEAKNGGRNCVKGPGSGVNPVAAISAVHPT